MLMTSPAIPNPRGALFFLEILMPTALNTKPMIDMMQKYAPNQSDRSETTKPEMHNPFPEGLWIAAGAAGVSV